MMFFLAGLGVLLIVYGCSVSSGYDVLLKRNESYAGIKVEGPVRYKSKSRRDCCSCILADCCMSLPLDKLFNICMVNNMDNMAYSHSGSQRSSYKLSGR